MTNTFISITENFFSKEECAETINFFENCLERGIATRRNISEGHSRHEVNDINVTYAGINTMKVIEHSAVSTWFMNKFWNDHYPGYMEVFSILKTHQQHGVYTLKLQKTSPGEGYHIWHNETSNRGCIDRLLTFILYLNDVDEGGETEFLYYPTRIKPKEGKFILFPGSFTHTHRGNQPLSGDKYILTGWVEYL